MNEPWAIESILNGTGGGGGGGNPIPPVTNVYVPVESWKYQDRIIDVVGFPWVADVPYPNVKASDFVSVIFGQEDAESGIFSNVCDSRTDAVRIFASEKPNKRIRIDTLSGFRPNASNSIWGNITGDIQSQQDLVDFVGDSNKIESIKANGTELTITDKEVNIPLATVSSAGLNFAYDSNEHNVYVSPTGSDTTGDGTQNNPWREIQTAINKTFNDLTKRIIIICAPGNYSSFSIKEVKLPFPDYELMALGDIIIEGGTCYIRNNNFTIRKNTQEYDYSISFITDSSIGIVIGKYANFTTYIKLNITANNYGLDANAIGTNVVLWRDINVTLTSNNPKYGVVIFNNSVLQAFNINVNSISGKGIALRIERSSVGIIESLTSNITDYSLYQGGLLSIGGKWVDQTTEEA